MIKSLALCMTVIASAACANPTIDRLIATARASFPELPRVETVDVIAEVCGGGVSSIGVYCPSERRIYLSATHLDAPQMPHHLAHLYGHAAQVTYGVADIALATIRANRPRETELRGMVTRQVECMAGVLIARSGINVPPLDALYASEPLTGSHWGANPVRNGPRVSIGLAARAEWFAIGRAAGQPDACSVGEMPADLIVAADRG